jgi:hypothetical protein
MANEVVAHFLDHHIVKGQSLDVDPAKPTCHIRTADQDLVEVTLADLKALFFVRDLAGDPARHDDATIAPTDARVRGAFAIEIEFTDGERLVGLTVRYPPIKPFFFVLPADGTSNNVRILVNRAAVRGMRQPAA